MISKLKKSSSSLFLISVQGLVVMSFSGQPALELKEKNKSIPIKKIELKKNILGDVHVRTKSGEFIIMRLNDRYELTVLPESNVLLTNSLVSLADGRLHLKDIATASSAVTSGDTHPVPPAFKISSEFFELPIELIPKISLFLDIKMKEAKLEICNLGSDFNVALYDDLNPQNLKANEGVLFQSSLTPEGRIAYDLLLEKRRAPKGQWSVKKSCDLKPVEDIQKKIALENEKKAKLALENKAKKAALKKKSDGQFLCQNPGAQLDQCRFILRQEGSDQKCFRERCNAEGKWAETAEVSVTKNRCSKPGEVSICGY